MDEKKEMSNRSAWAKWFGFDSGDPASTIAFIFAVTAGSWTWFVGRFLANWLIGSAGWPVWLAILVTVIVFIVGVISISMLIRVMGRMMTRMMTRSSENG